MDKIGGQEVLMPALQPKENWEITQRWKVKEMFKIKDEEFGLGWTHEEIITPLMKNIFCLLRICQGIFIRFKQNLGMSQEQNQEF